MRSRCGMIGDSLIDGVSLWEVALWQIVNFDNLVVQIIVSLY